MALEEPVRHPLFPEVEDDLHQPLSECFQSREWRSAFGRAETVEDTPEDACRISSMDMGIVSIQVAQARLDPEVLLFEDEKAVGALAGQRVRHPELEWHVEARNLEITGETYPAEIMDRGATARDQTKDPLQPVEASAWNLQYGTRLTAQSGQTGDKSDEQRAIFDIEGDVQKDALLVLRRQSFCRGHAQAEGGLLAL